MSDFFYWLQLLLILSSIFHTLGVFWNNLSYFNILSVFELFFPYSEPQHSSKTTPPPLLHFSPALKKYEFDLQK